MIDKQNKYEKNRSETVDHELSFVNKMTCSSSSSSSLSLSYSIICF